MYHFCKFNNTWYLKPESVQDITDHFKKICGREMQQGFNDFVDNVRFIKNDKGENEILSKNHSSSLWRCAVEFSMECHGGSWMEHSQSLEDRTYQHRIKMFLDGHDIYLADGLTINVPIETPEYEEEKWSDELVYPYKFDYDDVRFIKWPDGRHWYAKIGSIDIVDKHGNQKWNDKYYAMNVAKAFCQCGGDWSLYKNEFVW